LSSYRNDEGVIEKWVSQKLTSKCFQAFNIGEALIKVLRGDV
jgi:hypothetical protein